MVIFLLLLINREEYILQPKLIETGCVSEIKHYRFISDDFSIVLAFDKIKGLSVIRQAFNNKMVEDKGLEPSTSTLRTWRSPS